MTLRWKERRRIVNHTGEGSKILFYWQSNDDDDGQKRINLKFFHFPKFLLPTNYLMPNRVVKYEITNLRIVETNQ